MGTHQRTLKIEAPILGMSQQHRIFLRNIVPLVVVLLGGLMLLIGCQTGQGAGIANVPSQPASSPTASPKPMVGNFNKLPIATITYLQGEVLIIEASAQRGKPGLLSVLPQVGQPASPFERVEDGTNIQVSSGGQVGLICGEGTYVSGGSMTVNSATCAGGTPLTGLVAASDCSPPGYCGQLNENGQSNQLSGGIKEARDDYGRIPVIITPRDTKLLALQPQLQWAGVEDIVKYSLGLSGFNADFNEVEVEVECVEDQGIVQQRICSIPWPTEWELEHGEEYNLVINALVGEAGESRQSEEGFLETLSEDDVHVVEAGVERIRALGIDPITTDWLLAGLYTENGLYLDAIEAYERMLAQQPAAVVYVTLGDVYRTIDLQLFAFNAYEVSIKLLDQKKDDLSVRAAAELGKGYVEYNFKQFAIAESHFQKALELYTQLRVEEMVVRTQTALEATKKLLP